MKESLPSTIQNDPKTWRRMPGILILTLVIFTGLTSCETTLPTKRANPQPASVKKKPNTLREASHHSANGRWVLASRNPPVFHPDGLENPDYREGMWIATFSPEARWFIPRGGFDGRSEELLKEEASMLRTKFQKSRGAIKNTGKVGAGALKSTIVGGMYMGAYAATALGGGAL